MLKARSTTPIQRGMTDTADPTMLGVDDRAASVRSFFGVEPRTSTLPPPQGMMPIVPALPRVAPATPSPVPTTPNNPFEFSAVSAGSPPSRAPRQQQRAGGGRRFVRRVFLLAALGGIVFAGVKYGPQLSEQVRGDSADSELEAPLAFPAVTPAAVATRTATFVVEQPSDDGTTARYEVTTDFETGVSRMLIDRTTGPDIEVLAVFDVANLRLVDQPNWWSMPRGDFPFPVPGQSQQWIRTVDDYLPAYIRPAVTIEKSTEAVLGTETMRHLVLTIDTHTIVTNAAAVVIDPATGLQVPETPTGPGEFSPPASTTGNAERIEPVTVEMWVDSTGTIRKLVEPSSLGGRTITVVEVTSAPFDPTFPAPESTAPLTAAQLDLFVS